MPIPALLAALTACPAWSQEPPLLQNGGFETIRVVEGPASVGKGFGVWGLGEDRLAPAGWSLNPAHPGSLEVRQNGAADGPWQVHPMECRELELVSATEEAPDGFAGLAVRVVPL